MLLSLFMIQRCRLQQLRVTVITELSLTKVCLQCQASEVTEQSEEILIRYWEVNF
jgi:hypothetical protein